MDDSQLKALVNKVRRNLRVTKVVATRSIKMKNGEFFAGYSAAWNSVQPSGQAADLDLVMSDEEIALSGMTLQESRVAYYMLAMQADISCYEQARVNGAMSDEAMCDAIRAVKSNYAKLLRDTFLTAPPETPPPSGEEGGSPKD